MTYVRDDGFFNHNNNNNIEKELMIMNAALSCQHCNTYYEPNETNALHIITDDN